ncbi:MAG: four helix bundle protein [Candidatus Levybacteria bacterium]|nr:four helix bundle protein [Candidatus Levybacteria bacterium]
MKNEEIKNKNDKDKFKKDFKRRLYHFILRLIKFVDSLDKRDATCRVITEQLVDSGTGMLSNYLEALVASSKRDFTNYFHHCLKCNNESKMWIAVLQDSGKCNKQEANELLKELEEFGNIFGSSLLTLKGKKNFLTFLSVFFIFSLLFFH